MQQTSRYNQQPGSFHFNCIPSSLNPRGGDLVPDCELLIGLILIPVRCYVVPPRIKNIHTLYLCNMGWWIQNERPKPHLWSLVLLDLWRTRRYIPTPVLALSGTESLPTEFSVQPFPSSSLPTWPQRHFPAVVSLSVGCIQCSHPGCETRYHPYCAMDDKSCWVHLNNYWSATSDPEDKQKTSFCPDHNSMHPWNLCPTVQLGQYILVVLTHKLVTDLRAWEGI